MLTGEVLEGNDAVRQMNRRFRFAEGEPEHRDMVLDAQERTAKQRFIPCVSRCGGGRLVIDL